MEPTRSRPGGAATAVIIAVLAAIPVLSLSCSRRPAPLGSEGSAAGSPVQVPERRPSSGLAWSKKHYPRQYAAGNRASVELFGLENRSGERFLDIGGLAYGRQFVSGFSYTETARRPQVLLDYVRKAETFTGALAARGLKPNFAYQIKLRGVFSDRKAFERIGALGRWRLPDRKRTNYSDADYRDSADKSRAESYLLFDFFITDHRGSAQKEFYADSSLHVLYNSTWQRAPRVEDTLPVLVRRAAPGAGVYVRPRPHLPPQRIYAQSEGNNRPPVGEAFLPPGRYRAELVLTEESFHGFGDCGYWAAVMRAPVQFEIVERLRPSRGWSVVEPALAPLSLRRATVRDIVVQERGRKLLRGSVSGGEPSILFAEELELPEGPRYLLGFEFASDSGRDCQIRVSHPDSEKDGTRYRFRAAACRRWRRFEVEITSAVSGRRAAVQLDPAGKTGRIALRNVGIHKVVRY